MLELLSQGFILPSVRSRVQASRLAQFLWLSFVLGFTLLIGVFILQRGFDRMPVLILGTFTALIVLGSILYQPRYGLYVSVFLTLVGDSNLLPWYPFIKNFSSRESILFIHDSLIISPLEAITIWTIIAWFTRGAMQRKVKIFTGRLFWPGIPFLFFLLFGLAYGIATGGDLNIALWELRPIIYIFIFLITTSNLVEKREHVINLIWVIMAAIFIKALMGTYQYLFVLDRNLSQIDTITEHSASLHMNTFLIFAMVIWLYRVPRVKQTGLLLLVPVVAIAFLASQRRSAFIGLGIGLFLLAIVLFLEDRRKFWMIVPPITGLLFVYITIFWNNAGALGLPVQALKSVLPFQQINLLDQASNNYRILENINISFTIHQKPLTGVGFGQKYFIIVPLPDITFFQWWEYLTHNSVLWVWLKTGVGGFLSLLYFVGSAIIQGVRVVRRMPKNELRAIALTASVYFVMHFIYAYVDISWDAQSMIYIGVMLGVINSLEYIAGRTVPLPDKRWPWQPDPQPAPLMIPLENE